MLAHVHNVHTETALTLVNEKRTSLEHSLHSLILVIEITERHKVAEKSIEIAEDVEEFVREQAVKIYSAIGCQGLSRVDFFVTKDNRVVFNEINTIPGFTPISMYPKMMIHSGMTYAQLIDRMLAATFA